MLSYAECSCCVLGNFQATNRVAPEHTTSSFLSAPTNCVPTFKHGYTPPAPSCRLWTILSLSLAVDVSGFDRIASSAFSPPYLTP